MEKGIITVFGKHHTPYPKSVTEPESDGFFDYLTQNGIGSVSVMVDICVVFAVIALLGVIFSSVYLTTDISDKNRRRARLVRRLFLVFGAAPILAFGAAYMSMRGWIEIDPPTLFFVVLSTVLLVMTVRSIYKLRHKKLSEIFRKADTDALRSMRLCAILEALCFVFLAFSFNNTFRTELEDGLEINEFLDYFSVFSIIAVLIKIANILLPFSRDLASANGKKRSIMISMASILDLIGTVMMTVFIVITVYYIANEKPLFPTWLAVIYFVVPFVLYFVCSILFISCVYKTMLRPDKTSSAWISVLLKKQKLLVTGLFVFFTACAILGKVLPVAADKALIGDSFEFDLVNENQGFRECFSDDQKFKEIIEDKGVRYKLPAWKDTADSIACEGNKISVTYVVYDSDKDMDIVFELKGERKWYGVYDFKPV